MSKWTYISGVIKVDTFARSSAEAMYLAQTVVNHLPRISGSEGPVQYYLNLLEGYCSSSNCDEFDRRSNLYNSQYYRLFETQDKILITLDGTLRDRTFEQTLRETAKALARLSSRLWVSECLVAVTDCYNRQYVFNSPRWIVAREIGDWLNLLRWKEHPPK